MGKFVLSGVSWSKVPNINFSELVLELIAFADWVYLYFSRICWSLNCADFSDQDGVRNVVKDAVCGHDDHVTVLDVEFVSGNEQQI